MARFMNTDTWILVCDSGHAKLFRTQGGNDSVEEKADFERDVPEPREMMADDRGRNKRSRQAHQHHAYAYHSNPKDVNKASFIKTIAKTINQSADKVNRLVVAAPPKALAVLREEFSDQVKEKVIAEIDKDLIHCDERTLPQHLTPYMNLRDPLHSFDPKLAQWFTTT